MTIPENTLANVEKRPPPPVNRVESYDDEKVSIKADQDKANVAVGFFPGDVFEEVRDIDIGEDGKERPIGGSPSFFIIHT